MQRNETNPYNDDIIILIIITPSRKTIGWTDRRQWTQAVGCVDLILATASLNIAFTSFTSSYLRHSDQYEGHVCLYTANLISHKTSNGIQKSYMIMMTSPGAA